MRIPPRLSGLLKIALSLFLLALVWFFADGPGALAILAHAQPLWFALALAVYCAGVFVRAWRWRVLLAGASPAAASPAVSGISGTHAQQVPSLARLAGLYFVSFFFNSFLPTGIGGDIVRVAESARVSGTDAALSSVLADRFVGMVSVSALAVFALPFAGGPLRVPIGTIAAALTLGLPLAFVLFRRVPASALARLPKFPGRTKLQQAAATLASYRLRTLTLAWLIGLGFGLTNALTYACIGAGVGVALPLSAYLLASPMITLILLVPFSFNGLGARDWAYQALFTPLGVASANTAAMALAYHALNYLTALAGGLLYAAWGARETVAEPPQ